MVLPRRLFVLLHEHYIRRAMAGPEDTSNDSEMGPSILCLIVTRTVGRVPLVPAHQACEMLPAKQATRFSLIVGDVKDVNVPA
jgi:hypothetical protein